MTLILDGLTHLIWTQLWQVTLLIPLAIGLVRWACRGRSHLGYVILLAVLVKCVVPPLWSSPAGIFSWASHAMGIGEDSPDVATGSNLSAPESSLPNQIAEKRDVASSPASRSADSQMATGPGLTSEPRTPNGLVPDSPEAVLISPLEQPSLPVQDSAPRHWEQVGLASLLVLWILGIVGVVGYLLAKRVYLERFHDDTRVETKDELLSIVSECAIALDMRRHPDLVVTTHPTIPFVVGWWSPRLVIPKHIVDRSTHDDMRLIIAHELNHLRRWDTGTNWCQLAVQAIWWFHPLVWWLNAEIRRWRESCCDEEVVARLQCRPASYANCLLNVLDLQASLKSTGGLDSLSPFEVTKQRLHNIMQPVGPFPRSTPWPVCLAFLALTLIVLPGAAFTLPPQVAVAHDEIPTTPLIASSSAVPPPPPVAEAILPAGLQAATAAKPIDVRPSPWKYKFDVHRAYQYSVSIEEDGPRGPTHHNGQPVLHATYISGGHWQLNISNPELTVWEAPDPARPFGRGFRPPRIPGPFDQGYEVTIDSLGTAIDEASDSRLPLHLGRWSNWLIQPLPASDRPVTWDEEGTTTLSSMAEPTVGPFGTPDPSPFARPREISRVAGVIDEQTTQSREGTVLTLIRHRTVSTKDLVDGQPRLAVQYNSTWKFDSQLGVPVSLTGQGELVERGANESKKTPFQFKVQLLIPGQGPNTAAQTEKNNADGLADQIDVPQNGEASVSHVGSPIPADKKLDRGQKFIVEWNGSWFPGEVLDQSNSGNVKIHYSGWSEKWDETVPRSRIHFEADGLKTE